MKLFIQNIQLILILFGLTVSYSSCNKDADIPVYKYPTATFDSMSPTSGSPNSYANITGSNFGTWPQGVKVWIGGVKADSITYCSDNWFTVKIPAGAVSGTVTVQVWTTKLDSLCTFTVIKP